MPLFKFDYVSYDKILTSIKWKDMIDAIEQPFDEHLLVTWLPWCGKSTIATHRLDRLKKQKWLYLTYWKLLTTYVSQWLASNEAKSKTNSFWSWFFKNWNIKKDIEKITNDDIKRITSH